MGKPRIGKQVRKVTSIKVEPDLKEAIMAIYGSLSNFIYVVGNSDQAVAEKLSKLRSSKK